MAAKILCSSLELEPLPGFVEYVWFKTRSYPAHVRIIFLCDSDNKNLDFFTFQNLSGYFSFVHFGYDQNLII